MFLPVPIIVLAQAKTPKPPAPKPPVYASKEARRITQSAIAKYDRLRSVIFEVVDETGEKHVIALDRKLAKESGPKYAWSFDGVTLAILDKGKARYYSGKGAGGNISTYLGRAGTRMDPTARALYRRLNPVKLLVKPGSTVRRKGSVVLGGKKCQVIEVRRKDLRLTMLVRPDGLLQQTTTEAFKGRTRVLRAQRDFKYLAVNTKIGRSSFALNRPAGVKAMPLSALPKR